MSRILLIGHLPPQLCGQSKIEAANYRTDQFIQPLIEDGHTICLVAAPMEKNDKIPQLPAEWKGLVSCHLILFEEIGWQKHLQDISDQFTPDCIVAVNFDACLHASKLRTDRPIWMDIYGDVITIQQAACYRANSNRGLLTTLAFARQVLHKGDKFSVCGVPQRHMMVGELAMSGRLNSESFGYEFTEVIPAGMLPVKNQMDSSQGVAVRSELGLKNDAFTLLWCGGYNTWTDVDTLFKGIEWAMKNNPDVHFISVGANTYQASDNVYTRFQEMIDKSSYRDRYHLLGWKPWNELSPYYKAADAGVNIDALHYETIYGTRTRLMEMIAYKIPIITSLGPEISHTLQTQGAALVFEIGNWKQLGEHILSMAGNKGKRMDLAEKAYDYASQYFSFRSTTTILRRWVKNPVHAPDRLTPIRYSPDRKNITHYLRYLVRLVVWNAVGLDK